MSLYGEITIPEVVRMIVSEYFKDFKAKESR